MSVRVVWMTEVERAAEIEEYTLKALSAGLSGAELAEDVETRHPAVRLYVSEGEPGEVVVVVDDAPNEDRT